MRNGPRPLPALLLAWMAGVLIAAACTGEPRFAVADLPAWCANLDLGSGFAAVDSAGVGVVTSLLPVWPGGRDAATEARLRFGIGEEAGDAAYEFGQVGGAVRLSDGRIVVGDRQTGEIKVYDAAGTFLAQVGGQGDGPGEYRAIFSLHRVRGDSVLVNDLLGRRITTLGPDLTPAHTRPIPSVAFSRPPSAPGAPPFSGATFYQLRGRFDDGSLLAAFNGRMDRPQPTETLVTRDTLVLARVGAGAETGDSVGFVVGDERFLYFHPDNGAITFGPTVLGPVESLAVGGDRYYVGRAQIFEVEERAPDGRLLRLIRLCEEPDPLTPESVERAIERRMAPLTEEGRTREEPPLRNLPPAAVAPAYLELHLGDEGERLWVRSYTPPGEAQRWRVFDRGGRWLGSVDTPEDVRILQVGRGWMLGLHTDPLGVHSVRLLEFDAPG